MKVKLLILSLLFTIPLSAQDFWWWWDSDEDVTADTQYALQFSSGYMYVHSQSLVDLDPQGTSNLRNSTTYMGVDDSTKAYFIFDSAYVATNLDSMTEDISGQGNHGTIFGDLTWSTESRITGGKSLYFDGNSYIRIPPMDITNSFTAEVWFKIDSLSLTARANILFSQHPSGSNNFFGQLSDYGDIIFKTIGTNVNVITNTTKSYNDGKWHYVACVFDAGTAGLLYVDGELIYSQSLTGTTITNTGGMYIGGHIDGYNNFKGWIQEVRFTRRALTAQEIKNYYNNFTEDYSKWTDNGNHSIADDAGSAVNGTNGGRIISTGAGDAISNNVALPIAENLVNGYKYMVSLSAKAAYNNNDTLVVQIGSNQKKIALTDTGYVRTVYHIQSGGDDSVKVYLTKADTAFIDYIQIKRKYDYLILSWNKSSITTNQRILNASNGAIYSWLSSSGTSAGLKDQFGVAQTVSLSSSYDTTKWNLTGLSIDWTGNFSTFLNTNIASITTHQLLGDVSVPFNNAIGIYIFGISPQYFQGKAGSIAIYRFNDINDSDFNLASLVDSANTSSLSSITGGGARLVALWDWADTYNYSKAMPEINTVYGAGQYNRLTPVTITVDNRIILLNKYEE